MKVLGRKYKFWKEQNIQHNIDEILWPVTEFQRRCLNANDVEIGCLEEPLEGWKSNVL
jgi:hypothetical protein